AARLARLAGGRSGLAVAYASSPDAERIRGELTRTLLDLLGQGRAARLRAARDLFGRAAQLATLAGPPPAPARAEARRGRAKAGAVAAAESPDVAPTPAATADAPGDPAAPETEGKASASERRRALAILLDAWRLLARDLALAQLGATTSIRDVPLLEE